MPIDTAYFTVAFGDSYIQYELYLDSVSYDPESGSLSVDASYDKTSDILGGFQPIITLYADGTQVDQYTTDYSAYARDVTLTGQVDSLQTVAVVVESASREMTGDNTVEADVSPSWSGSCNVTSGTVRPNETVVVEAVVSNNGLAGGEASISLLAEGSEVDTTTLTIPAGGETTYTVDLEFDEPGDYDITFSGDGF